MTNYTEFGIEARKIMLQRNIKMIHIAKELGVSSTYVSEIFKGTREGKKQKPIIAEILGIEIEVTE
ncbi:helix-turn-helix domain-containing protein [Paenibacillus maysiensis]|uniref:helix-turn-helix domain-containing protein n=1 Tax=Paenibacillus maysiensis TaxID=1155954 RepID=UPI00046F1AFD|nr:helix-turn-helix transcriptional regulator [Paenibacillus maysiensis]